MFGTMPMYPTAIKPEEEKSIFRNGLNVYMNGIYSAIGHTISNLFNIGSIYMMMTQDLKEGLSLVIAEEIMITGICQSANWAMHEMAAESTERNKTAKEQKIKYRDAINNKDANLVYKLEEEQTYLIKWGERFIKNYNTIKPRQLKIPYESDF